MLRYELVWMVPVAPHFFHGAASDPSHYNMDVWAHVFSESHILYLYFFPDKKNDFGAFRDEFFGGDQKGEFDERLRKGSSWLQEGKPLRILNPREKLSLKKRKKI